MGQLRTSLTNAIKLTENLRTTSEKYGKQLSNLTKGADSFVKGGFAGIDELYLYVVEKLKKKGIDIEKAKNVQLKTIADANIKRYLAGVQFIIDEASKFTTEFAAIADDKSVDNTLTALEPVLKGIEDQIRKKKKKLLQSKKFKVKITNYEGTLATLRKIIAECREDLTELRRIKPPSPTQIRRLLFATEDSKLVDLKNALSADRKKLHDDYNSLLLKLNQSSGDIREQAEFAEVMKMIKQMVADSDDMEKEGD